MNSTLQIIDNYYTLSIKCITRLLIAGLVVSFSIANDSNAQGKSQSKRYSSQSLAKMTHNTLTENQASLSKSNEHIEKKITVNFNEVTLEKALKTIAKESNLKLSYGNFLFAPKVKVTLQAENETVNNILWKVLEGTNLKYAISENGHLVFIRSNFQKENSVQIGTIRGTVTDANSGDVLPGANIFVEGINKGAATDMNGEYAIEGVATGLQVLQVSYIGYTSQSQEVTIKDGENIVDFSLEQDVSGLEDVIVTGIASRTSRAVSEVAVSRIEAEDLTETNTYSGLSDLLSGKAAGVNIQPASGSVGSGIRFKMRSGGGLKGNGQPVIYVDGVRIDNSEVEGLGAGGQGFGALADLNPEEISDVNILKGPAAAALYGTSGSNGVVLITTKSGRGIGNDIIQADYKGTFGFNEQKTLYTEREFLTADSANAQFREGAIRQHALSVSGGTGQLRYYTSFTNRFEEGLIRGNDMDRTSLRANFDVFASENLTIGVNTSYTINKNNRQLLDNAFGPLNNTLFISDKQIWSKTGSREAVYAFEDELNTNRFIGSLDISWSPIQNFELRASIGHDQSDMGEVQIEPYGYAYGGFDLGTKEIFRRENQQQTYDLNARYSYDLSSDINLTSIVGTQIFNRKVGTLFIDKETFPSQGIINIGAASAFLNADETALHERSAGIFTQHELNFRDTYFVTLGGRQDYASSVGLDAPNIFYPKASAAVRVDQFDILPTAVNFLKFRAAYGESGQLPEIYDGANRLWAANNYAYGAGAVLSIIGNPQIKPERVKELEFGVEAELFENLGIDLTYYIQRAQDSIIEYQQSPSTGLTADNLPFNVGSVKGSGLEMSVQASVIQTSETSLNFGLIWNYSTNEVTDLGAAQPIFDANNVITEGLPRSAFYDYRNDGAIFDENGLYAGDDIKFGERVYIGTPYPEHNGSLSMNFTFLRNFNLYVLSEWALDLYVYNSTAQIAEGYGNYAKRLRLAAQINADRYREVWETEFPDIQQLEPGTQEYIDAANEYAILSRDAGFGYVQRADWFKIRELSLSYNFRDLLESAGLSNTVRDLAATFSVRNLYNYSLYEGPDPEVHWQGARTIGQGRDFTTLQQPRTYNFTLSVGF